MVCPPKSLVLAIVLLAVAVNEFTSARRHVLNRSWTVRWTVGGSPGDTTLVLPLQLAADDSELYVLDPRAHGITALSLMTGKVLWRYSDIAHPLQLPTTVAARIEGGAIVADAFLHQLLLFDQNGRVVSQVPYMDGYVHAICDLGDNSYLAVVERSALPLVWIDSAGGTKKRTSMPWGADETSRIASQTTLARGSERRCLLSQQLGGHFAVLSKNGKGWAREYIRDRASWLDKLMGRPFYQTALTSTFDSASVAVAAWGHSRYARKAIDLYSADSGSYRGTIILPFRVFWMVFARGNYYVIHGRNGIPEVSALSTKEASQ